MWYVSVKPASSDGAHWHGGSTVKRPPRRTLRATFCVQRATGVAKRCRTGQTLKSKVDQLRDGFCQPIVRLFTRSAQCRCQYWKSWQRSPDWWSGVKGACCQHITNPMLPVLRASRRCQSSGSGSSCAAAPLRRTRTVRPLRLSWRLRCGHADAHSKPSRGIAVQLLWP